MNARGVTYPICHAVEENPRGFGIRTAFRKADVMTGLDTDDSEELEDFGSDLRRVGPTVKFDRFGINGNVLRLMTHAHRQRMTLNDAEQTKQATIAKKSIQ